MRILFRALFEELQNPEIASSFVPLLVVVSVFTLVSTGTIYLVLRMLRPPKKGAGVTHSTGYNPLRLVFKARVGLNPFLRPFVPHSDREKDLLAQLEELRRKYTLLEDENSELRELHAKSVGKVQELTDEMKTLEAKRDETAKQLEFAHQQRERSQARVEELESQTRDIMKQIDDMYEENAKALDAANERRNVAQKKTEEVETQLQAFITDLERLYRGTPNYGELQKLGVKLGIANFAKDIAPATPPPLLDASSQQVSHLTEENRKLKELLKVCREQIVAISKQHRAAAATKKAS